MDKKLKAKWLKALRSGEYEQGKQELKQRVRHNGKEVTAYCCLGVLREIMHPRSTLEGETEHTERVLHERHTNEAEILPKHQDKLADMNDDGQTFKKIAQWIERVL